jgi:two-component system, chemotaxis family, sensor kinase CheA
MDLSAFYSQFREETQENIRVLSETLVSIEQLPVGGPERRASLDRVFRAVHTVKGSARMLGFEPIGQLAHVMETLLGELRQGERELDPPLADQLLRGGDALLDLTIAAVEGRPSSLDLAALLASFEGSPPAALQLVASEQAPAPAESRPQPLAPAPSPQPPAPKAPSPFATRSANRQTVRVRVDRLDKLINLAGELVVDQQFLAHHSERLSELESLIEQQTRAARMLADELARLRFSQSQRQLIDGHLGRLLSSGDQLRRLAIREGEQLERYSSQHGAMVDDLEREVLAARMVPIATLFASIPRAVRDLAGATHKQVALELVGETTELDRKVIELLSDPILHLVRNAIDHGIEPPADRAAAGKPLAGKLRIAADASGGEVRVIISDDGRGMDPQQLRETAARRGLISADQARLLSDAESYELIFAPGFSTATLITEISGRGVGMDVVRSNITDLGGQVTVESQLGQGSKITLSLPLTLITTRIILVRLGRSLYALPASGCKGTLWVYRSQVDMVEGRETIEHGGKTISLVYLADMLGVEAEGAYKRGVRSPALLIGSGGRMVAAIVDDLVDEREAVVKPLGPLFERQRIYGGAVQLGDGGLVLLLNPLLLARRIGSAQRSKARNSVATPSARARVLVSDDSFTTRELIKSILSSAGYAVTAAVDGQDALDKLRAGAYDLVVSDVEMPRVDGFQLTSRIRRELGRQDLPVILITSLASDAHKRQGLEAGAQAYFVKSQFNQDSLLEVIQQLLGHEEL